MHRKWMLRKDHQELVRELDTKANIDYERKVSKFLANYSPVEAQITYFRNVKTCDP